MFSEQVDTNIVTEHINKLSMTTSKMFENCAAMAEDNYQNDKMPKNLLVNHCDAGDYSGVQSMCMTMSTPTKEENAFSPMPLSSKENNGAYDNEHVFCIDMNVQKAEAICQTSPHLCNSTPTQTDTPFCNDFA